MFKKIKKLVPKRMKAPFKKIYDYYYWIKMYRKTPVILENKFGFKVIVYPWNKSELRNIYIAVARKHEYAALSKLIKCGDTTFDVGANLGAISIFLSKAVGTEGIVHSFEPIGKTFNYLKQHITVNNCENIYVHKIALADFTGETKMHVFSEDKHTLNSLGKVTVAGEQPTSQELVITQTLDNTCSELNIEIINLLKIDVEGFEAEVIRGSKNLLLNKKIDYIQFEISEMPLKSLNKSSQEVFNLLQQYHYKVYKFDYENNIFTGPIRQADSTYENYYASANDLTKF
jgi:FkbM family methyltransferase